MPFEGSAIARSISAEYIAAARQRSRSLSQSQAAGPIEPSAIGAASYDTQAPPQLFISPSPIYAVARRDDEHYRPKNQRSPSSSASPTSPSRGFSSLRGTRSRGAAGDAIPEAHDEEGGHPAATTPGQRSGSESDRTLGAENERDTETERDVEQGDAYPVVGEPKYRQQEREKRKHEKDNQQKDKEEKDPFLVTLEGREHLNPHTWKVSYRWFLTGLAGMLVLNATFASSGPSQLIPRMEQYFGFSSEVGTLTIALFVAGYCVGPLLWGPLSERYGRKIVFIVAFIPYTGFQVGCALSKNTASILVFRFLGGCFAASPLTNSGGVIADLWDADRRGIAMAIFSLAPFAGPAIAPIVSGALEVQGSDWRWIFWILTIFAGACLIAIVLLLPETYVPYILHKEAKRIRKETGDDRYHSASEHPDHKVTLGETLHHTVLKPFIMIVQEPMLLLLTLYLSFVYGIVYLLFEALPIVFQQEHGFNALEGGLCFLGLPVGGFIAVLIYAFYFNKVYIRKHHALKGKMVPPEERLKPLMVAAPAFAVAFFWFGWTYYKSINPASPILAVVLLGLCILWMFLSVFNYLIDSYLASAASALAIKACRVLITVCRSAFGAGFPLFASQMYAKLGTPGASSLLGGLAIVFMPIPFVLYKYGKKIRSMSKNAMVLD